MSKDLSGEEFRKVRNHCKNNKDKKFEDEKIPHKKKIEYKRIKRQIEDEDNWQYWQEYYK